MGLVLLSNCGGGGGSETAGDGEESFDREGASAAVDDGLQALQDLINSEPEDFPYSDVSGIAQSFENANSLDPTYDDAAFWSALFELFTFLDQPATQAFLAKLGWEDFSLPGEFLDFVDRFGQTAGAALELAELSSPDPEAPPLHDLFLPNDPNQSVDPNPCYDPQDQSCEDPAGWTATQVIFLGTEPWVDVTFAELYAFLTEALGGAVRGAVARLKGIDPGFSTSISALPFDESSQVPVVLTIDRFEVDLIQAIYGVVDVILSLPQIWTYTGADAFVSTYSIRDPATGELLDTDMDGTPDMEITTDDAVAYFKTGMDGVAGTGDEPLRANPGGLTRLRNALRDLLGALEGALERLATGDPLAGHVIPVGLLLDTYDDQPAVLAYGAGVFAATAADLRNALAGPTTLPVRVPVATIQNFDTCEPLAGGSPANTDPMVTTPFWSETDLATLNSGRLVEDLGELTAGGHATVSSTDVVPDSNGYYYYRFTLLSPADVSIYTTSAAGVNADTDGAIAYLADVSQVQFVQPWDGDSDSGEQDHFGLSVAADYMNTSVMADIAVDIVTSAMTFYIQVADQSGGDFDLHVHVVPDGDPWPETEPIFLKGGGGRNFLARTYELGSARVNLGAALGVLSNFWDLSDRDTLSVTDDPDTGDTVFSLFFDNSTVAQSIASILPDADLAATGLLQSGTFDVFNDTLDLDLANIGLTISEPPLDQPAFGTAAFCAMPDDLSTFFQVAGGRLALPF